MSILTVKVLGVTVLALTNLALLIQAGLAYRHKRSLGEGYYRLLVISPVVGAIQVIMGFVFLAMTYRAPAMHIFYGGLVAVGALAQAGLHLRFEAGQLYRGKPLIHAFLALFVLLLSLRSYMAA